MHVFTCSSIATRCYVDDVWWVDFRFPAFCRINSYVQSTCRVDLRIFSTQLTQSLLHHTSYTPNDGARAMCHHAGKDDD